MDQVSNPPLETPIITIPENWFHTQVKVNNFSYMWTISNFSVCHNKLYELQSSIFPSGFIDGFQWIMKIYPKGYDVNSRGYLSLHLLLLSNSKENVECKYKFTMLNSKQEKLQEVDSGCTEKLTPGWCVMFMRFIKLSVLFDNLPDNELTIFCDVSIYLTDYVNISCESNFSHMMITKSKLSTDMGKILENKQFSDVTLAVSDGNIEAHKVILAARSPVFRAMFEHEIEESEIKRVNLTDVNYKVLMEMLRYIYTGKVTNIEEMAEELLAAADKYALEGLKAICEMELCKKLSVENAAKTLALSDRHTASNLKTRTLDFINIHATEVTNTRGWNLMIKTHPPLIGEAFRILALSRKCQRGDDEDNHCKREKRCTSRGVS